jgi:hypothetical protein
MSLYWLFLVETRHVSVLWKHFQGAYRIKGNCTKRIFCISLEPILFLILIDYLLISYCHEVLKCGPFAVWKPNSIICQSYNVSLPQAKEVERSIFIPWNKITNDLILVIDPVLDKFPVTYKITRQCFTVFTRARDILISVLILCCHLSLHIQFVPHAPVPLNPWFCHLKVFSEQVIMGYEVSHYVIFSLPITSTYTPT